MPNPAKIGNGWGGTQDYLTYAQWYAAESGVDYGSKIIGLGKGYLGSGTISGTSPHGWELKTDGVVFDGTNAAQLATINYPSFNAPNGLITSVHCYSSNTYQNPSISADNTYIENSLVINTSRKGGSASSSYAALRLASGVNKGIRNSVIVSNNCSGIRTDYGLDGNVESCLVINDNNYSYSLKAGGNATQEFTKTIALNGNPDLTGTPSLMQDLATSDVTGTITGASIARDVKNYLPNDIVNSDFRVPLSSPLHALGIGAFFESGGSTTPVTKAFSFNVNLLERYSANHLLLVSLIERRSHNHQKLLSLLSTNRVSKNFAISLELVQRLNKSFIYSAELLTRNTKNHYALINTLARLEKQFTIDLELLVKKNINFNGNINFLGRVSLDFTGIINLLSARNKVFQKNVDLYQSINKSFEYKVNLLSSGTVSKQFSLLIDFEQRVSKNFAFEFDLLKREGMSHQAVVNLLSAVSKDFATLVEFNKAKTTQYRIELDYIGRENKLFSVVFNIESDDQPTIKAHYIVNTGNTIIFTNQNREPILFKDKTKKLLF